MNVQHLPGWDREVHPPQPEGQPGPRPPRPARRRCSTPATRPPHPARRPCRHCRHPKRPVIGVVRRGLVAVGHHRARLNVRQHETCVDLNRSFRLHVSIRDTGLSFNGLLGSPQLAFGGDDHHRCENNDDAAEDQESCRVRSWYHVIGELADCGIEAGMEDGHQ